MLSVNYQKRKNTKLFTKFENVEGLELEQVQNYIPIYKRFFSLNESNYNSINLNHPWYIYDVKRQSPENDNVFDAKIKNINLEEDEPLNQKVFFKLAPILDPFKLMTGKYDLLDNNLFKLPNLSDTNCHPKVLDSNNSSYVDAFFSYLSSMLNTIHSIEYYGSFIGIKNKFKINIIEDLEYLLENRFFLDNSNILFDVEDFSQFIQPYNESKLKPIQIHNESRKSILSAKSINNDIFEDIFTTTPINEVPLESSIIDLNDLKDMSVDISVLESTSLNNSQIKSLSASSCSSRTSHTNDLDISEEEEEGEGMSVVEDNEHTSSTEWESVESNESNYEPTLYATIPKFPVQIICMEKCEDTFDNLILTNELTHSEWFSALIQVIMTLIIYQKSFSFTHNDLHTNNVMYVPTNMKHIYYLYNKQYYKVPTHGRIFKIIDFGRSIYKVNGKVFCSDSFQPGGDAATQYNTEPYFNEKKPRLEPNPSFDLCRLGCSIFDYLIEDLEEIKDLSKLDSITRLIVEWCTDDNGVNVLYKTTGVERYPDFKLYKMIARCVHNHTPQNQLERAEFKDFLVAKKSVPKDTKVINIDEVVSYV
jgi:hypothetical protein